MRLTSLHLREIRMPLKEPFRISSGVATLRRILLVAATDEEGRVGWGECTAGEEPNYSSETTDTAWLAIREWVAPLVLGREIAGPFSVRPLLEHNFRGHSMAKAAVEVAVWDLEAQRRGLPLAGLIGEGQGEIRKEVEVGISLGIQASPRALAERAADCLARGYRKIKIKIGPGEDLDYLAAVREALGPEAPVMADANNAYGRADFDRLAALDEFDLMMIEQPLACDDLLRHAELQKLLLTPICLDESITCLDRAEDMVALDAGRIVNIKVGRVGGIASALAIHDFCRSRGVPVWCGGMLESGIGRAVNVALASLPGFTFPGDISPSERYWERDVVTPEWTMDGHGRIRVPLDRPGLGVAVDLDRIEDLTARSEVLAAR
ncbi:MAG TPA: o-succinylbenzoate synthase [Thermoanaerobaculia bacterium]|nr:o-succinylbenzoate synthase [Thermoanaerobaculia bacterium]